MAASSAAGAYKEALVFLATAGLIVPLFHRIRISPVLGFLAAGAALGPFGLGRLAEAYPWLNLVTISRLETIAPLGEFGVVFLLFMIGLELSFERLSRMRRLVFGLGSLEVLVATVLIAGCAVALGLSPEPAIVLGAALSLSSTAIAIPVLAERKRLATAAGRTAFSVLLFQDLLVAPLLVVIAVIGGVGEARLATGVVLSLGLAVLGLVLLLAAGRLILRPLLRLVAETRSPEWFTAACLLVVVAAGIFANSTGLSMGLGAFIAGLLLAETEFRREIEVTIEPFKGLLLGLFFMSVGAGLDLAVLLHAPVLILGLTAGLIALKVGAISLLARLFGLPHTAAGEAALVLGPAGEFSFVIVGAATEAQIISPPIGETVLVVATLSMATIPFWGWLGQRLGKTAPTAELPPGLTEPPPGDRAARVIIVGYGRVGKLVGEMLARHATPYLSVDSDPRVVAREREAGKAIYFGNAARGEFLRRCGIAEARALVVTMDAPEAVEEVVAVARAERPDLPILARARDTAHARRLYELGATDAVPETIEASLQLAEAVLVDVGVPMGYVIASVHEKRDEFRKALAADKASGGELRAIRRPSSPRRS